MILPIPRDENTLVLRRIFPAPRQRVFRAWLEPRALEYWLRPGGRSMTVARLETRTGGSFSFALEGGGSIFGTYLQIAAPEKLVFTWSGDLIHARETIVTLDFFDLGPTTEVVLTHERLTPELYTLFGSGWQSLLAALAKALVSSDFRL